MTSRFFVKRLCAHTTCEDVRLNFSFEFFWHFKMCQILHLNNGSICTEDTIFSCHACMDTSEYSAVHFFNRVCKLMSQSCYHIGRTSQHGNLSSLPHCSITPPARGAATWGQSYFMRHQSRQANKCVSNILRSSSSACLTGGEIDKTDPLDKLQHKMNLVSNYFTK
jgi:hypothetical protein